MDLHNYDPFDDRADFRYVWCWWPRRCYMSRKWLFCELAVRGRWIITGPGEPVIEDRWYHRHEALIKIMRGSHYGFIR